MMPPGTTRNQHRPAALLLTACLLASSPATSASLSTGSDVQLRWDTTLWFRMLLQPHSAAYNLDVYCPAAAVTGAAPSCGYGGIRSARVDAMTALDLNAGAVGLHVGAIAWYDAADRPESGRLEIDPSARGGQAVELFEAYGRAGFDIGTGRLSFNAGRHTLTWGEALFFTENGIASAQAPIDAYRPQSRGSYGGSEAFLPVNQISASWLSPDGWSVAAYLQLEWRRNRIDVQDAYASASDTLGAPGNHALLLRAPDGTPLYFARTPDRRPSGTSQYGVALRGHLGIYDVGLYALRFAAKNPVVLFGTGAYRLDFPRDIELYGLSVAGPIGAAGFGFELSGRRNMPLVNAGIALPPGATLAAIDVPRFEPRGDSLQAQASWLQKLEPSLLFASGADWNTEIAANYLLTARNEGPVQRAGRTRFALALRTELTPHLFQIVPHVDLSFPIAIGLNLAGLSSVDSAMNRGTGDVSLGARAEFDQNWKAELTLTHYIGRAKNGGGPFAPPLRGETLSDWDSIRLAFQVSF
jgi:Protein of unknown function (DUF1302)